MGLPSPGAFYALSRVDQDEALVHWQRDRDQCPKCGRPASQCTDATTVWYPQRLVCFATMEQQAAEASYERLHEKAPWHDGTFTDWVEKPDRQHPYHFKFGVQVFAAEVDLDPGDSFTVDPKAQPAALRAAATDEEG